MKWLEFEENNISNEGFAEISRALSVQPQLEELKLGCYDTYIWKMSLFAVGMKSLILSHNDIGDEG